MTVEEREQRWTEAMCAERRGDAVAYERMLKERRRTALRRCLRRVYRWLGDCRANRPWQPTGIERGFMRWAVAQNAMSERAGTVS